MTKSRPFQVGRMYHDSGRPITLQERDDALVLADGKTHRTPMMLKDNVAGFACKECQGRGRWLDDLNITCPFCHGSGLVNSNGDETNNTEAARGGEFGTDHAINDAKIQDAIARDRAWRDATAGSRPGWYVTDAGKEHHTRMTDIYAAVDDEREAAYKEPRTSPDVAWSTGAGSEARNFGKPAPDGSACMLDGGQRGVIRNGQCVALSEDSRTVSQVAADHAQNMQNVYQEHENFLQNAYKNLR